MININDLMQYVPLPLFLLPCTWTILREAAVSSLSVPAPSYSGIAHEWQLKLI